MSELRETYAAKLEKYTKAQLIYGIIRTVNIVDMQLILSAAEQKRLEEEDKHWEELSEAHTKAAKEHSDYLHALFDEYGDGKSVEAKNIPSDKLDKLSQLAINSIELLQKLLAIGK